MGQLRKHHAALAHPEAVAGARQPTSRPLEQTAWQEGEEGQAPLLRRPGNWLALKGGKPILFVEQHGRKLTPAPGATADDLAAAALKLGELLRPGLGTNLRGKLCVEEWAGGSVIGSPGQPALEAAGFVRDYQALALYAAYR